MGGKDILVVGEACEDGAERDGGGLHEWREEASSDPGRAVVRLVLLPLGKGLKLCMLAVRTGRVGFGWE